MLTTGDVTEFFSEGDFPPPLCIFIVSVNNFSFFCRVFSKINAAKIPVSKVFFCRPAGGPDRQVAFKHGQRAF